jgi:hypothetical protein
VTTTSSPDPVPLHPEQDAAPEQEAFLAFADAAIRAALAVLDGRAQQPIDATVLLETDSPFAQLCENAGAYGAAAELLAILLACDMDAGRGTRVAALSGSSVPGPLTLGAAARLLGDVRRCAEAAGPDSALQRAALVEIVTASTWAATEVRLAPSVVWALAGDGAPDPELPVGTRLQVGVPKAPGGPGLVLVSGTDPTRRRALGLARTGAGSLLVSPTPPTTGAEWAALVREASIIGSGVLVELDTDLPPEARRWVERATHLDWVLSSRDEVPLDELPDRPRVELVADDDVVDEAEWRAALGDVPHTHRLRAHQLERVRLAREAVGGDVDTAVRRLLGGPLSRLAHRVRPHKGWDDLVLGESKTAQLRSVVGRYRHSGTVYDRWGVTTASGRGVVALFTGPSGTGKTLAAEVVAHALELDLYRIDLSTIVSKYIGETEQNLDRLFDAASAGNAVLFFDEADSVFGKRSEVKDARDRYANLEVSYLLQRLEGYDGVVVLATNLPGNIDDAFLRRIHEVVHFTQPSAEERLAIWRRHLGDGDLPVGDFDVSVLARRFELTGGQIRNIVLAAAFRAAEEGVPVSRVHLDASITAELRKLGRILRPEDFGDH